ncbi:MAG: hypothetical protein M3235_09640 [Actinomycetota bacterium]|nr:hypothetical protein [Actinomycetota bacterium]
MSANRDRIGRTTCRRSASRWHRGRPVPCRRPRGTAGLGPRERRPAVPHQFAEPYETAETFAGALGLRRRPELFLANGNGALNAFAAQATGHDYVVLSNELFANLYQNNARASRRRTARTARRRGPTTWVDCCGANCARPTGGA